MQPIVIMVDSKSNQIHVSGGRRVGEKELTTFGEAQEDVTCLDGRHRNRIFQTESQPAWKL